jgi:hypothetical protein
VIETEAAVEEQGKGRVGGCLSISRSGRQQQNKEVSPSFHLLKVYKKIRYAYRINK